MWIEEAEELFKGYLPYYLFIVLPIFIIISPVNPVAASYEFPVHRMQQFDLHGTAHGCRSSLVNLEARSVTSWGTSRHCVVSRLKDLTIDQFTNIRAKAGALLIVLPEELSLLTPDEKQHLLLLENAMLALEVSIPVYFMTSNAQLEKIVNEISDSFITDDKSNSAAEALLNSVAANGYQIVISTGNNSPRPDIKIATVQGTLAGLSHDGKTPTIGIVAYYDSFGVAPELSFGADSNASGVVILLELIRLFSTLYSDPKTHGKYNIVFLLTGGGKFNYQGSKKWLEDQLDSLDGSIIQDASYIVCLDTLTASDSLYMHVSKPPKDGSAASIFFKEMKTISSRYKNSVVDGVHKKINLAEDLLAWEHERYSIRRLPAFTISSVKNHKDNLRGTILDTKENLDLDRLVRHAEIIAESLASHIYNVSVGPLFGNQLKVERSALEAWIDHLGSQPRSSQLLSTKDHPLVATFKEAFNKYLRDVKTTYVTPDKRDPDFIFYDVTKAIVHIYSVKPAIFDLVLTVVIVTYLGVVYLLIQKFPTLYHVACSVTVGDKKEKPF